MKKPTPILRYHLTFSWRHWIGQFVAIWSLLVMSLQSADSAEKVIPEYCLNTTHITSPPKPIKVYKLRKQIVDCFFVKYEKSVRPHPTLGDDPTRVAVSVFVSSISSVNELSMQFTADLYVRQRWLDPRLKFKVPESVSIPFVKLTDTLKIWVPDIFFPQERHASRHMITVQNAMVRVFQNGTIFYVERFSIVFGCEMNLVRYPFDVQRCEIQLGSFSDTVESVTFDWMPDDPISVNPDVRLPKFSVESIETRPCINEHKTGNFSCLKSQLIFKRQLGFYLVESYLPTTLLVMASWLGFWIDASSVPGRVCLSVTTLLTTVAQTTNIKNNLPPVSYVKAIDIWCCICMFYVFMALAEFAFVNYLDYLDKQVKRTRKPKAPPNRTGSDRHPLLRSFQSFANGSAKSRKALNKTLNNHNDTANNSQARIFCTIAKQETVDEDDDEDEEQREMNAAARGSPFMTSSCDSAMLERQTLVELQDKLATVICACDAITKGRLAEAAQTLKSPRVRKSKQIDTFASVAFPLTFFIISMVYAYTFAYSVT